MPHQILSAPPRLDLVFAALNPPCSVTLHGCSWLPETHVHGGFGWSAWVATCVDRQQPMQTRC